MRLRVLLTRTAIAAVASLSAIATVSASAAQGAGTLIVSTCGASVFQHAAVFGLNTLEYCPSGTNAPPGMSIMTGGNKVSAGTRATWQANAPSGIAITGASVATNQMYSIHINDGTGWGGGFYWSGGGAQTDNGDTSYGVSGLNSGYFGFQAICGWSTCNGSTNPAQLTIESIKPRRDRDAGAVADRSRRALAGVGMGPGRLATRVLRQLAVWSLQPDGEP